MKIFKSGPGIGFLDSRYVNVTGDTMTGGLTINTNSTTALLIEQDGVKDNTLVVDTTNEIINIGSANPVVKINATLNNAVGGKLRFVERSYQGGYLHFDGSANNFIIGVHNTDDSLTSSDIPSISIARGSGDVTIPQTTTISSGDLTVTSLGSSAITMTRTSVPQSWEIGRIGIGGEFYILDVTDSNNYAFTIEPGTQNFGINQINPQGKFHITGARDDQQLIVQANATQTANLTEWQNSSGAVLSGADSSGRIFSYGGSGLTTNAFYNGAGNSTLTGEKNYGLGTSALSSLTSGYENVAIGTEALMSITSGDGNFGLGYRAGRNITGIRNVAIGTDALYGAAAPNASNYNVAIGQEALKDANVALRNIAIGYQSGQNVTSGTNNVLLGYDTGDTLTTQSGNIFLGYRAGRRHTLSNRFIVDNGDRDTEADEISNSILYGIMAALPANQDLYINADLYLKADSRPIYFGGGDDMSIYYDGTNGNIDTDLVAPSDLYIDCGTGKTLMLEVPVWRSHDLAPQRVKLPADNPPAEDTIDGFGFHRYNRGTEESTYFTWTVPQCFATGTANVRGYYVFLVENPPAAETADENVRMGFEYKKISDGDVFDFDAGTSSGYIDETIAQGEDAYKLHYTSNGVCDTTGWEAGDTILFRFYRDATAPEDTYDNEASADDNDVWLKTYHIEYKTNKIGAVS